MFIKYRIYISRYFLFRCVVFFGFWRLSMMFYWITYNICIGISNHVTVLFFWLLYALRANDHAGICNSCICGGAGAAHLFLRRGGRPSQKTSDLVHSLDQLTCCGWRADFLFILSDRLLQRVTSLRSLFSTEACWERCLEATTLA